LSDEALEAFILSLAGNQNLVESPPAGLQSFFNRVQPVENFHEEDCRWGNRRVRERCGG
jgi:hypothetical protein